MKTSTLNTLNICITKLNKIKEVLSSKSDFENSDLEHYNNELDFIDKLKSHTDEDYVESETESVKELTDKYYNKIVGC